MESLTTQEQAAADFAIKTGAALGMTAGYLQSHDVQEMLHDVEEAARRNPMPALIGAAAFGVLLSALIFAGGRNMSNNVVDRGITDILKDTVSNIQDIIRSKIILAKIEIKEELAKAKAAGVMFGVAASLAFFGIGFCLLCVVYALALVLPAWAAALIVGVASLLVAGIVFAVARARWGKVHLPKKTMFTVKEDVAWMRSQSKS